MRLHEDRSVTCSLGCAAFASPINKSNGRGGKSHRVVKEIFINNGTTARIPPGGGIPSIACNKRQPLAVAIPLSSVINSNKTL